MFRNVKRPYHTSCIAISFIKTYIQNLWLEDFVFLKVSYAHQSCIYLIKYIYINIYCTVKTNYSFSRVLSSLNLFLSDILNFLLYKLKTSSAEAGCLKLLSWLNFFLQCVCVCEYVNMSY